MVQDFIIDSSSVASQQQLYYDSYQRLNPHGMNGQCFPTRGFHPQQAHPPCQPYGGPALQPGATNSNDLRQWQRGNLRSPPSWSPEVQNAYPFRHWAHDVMSWSVYTDLPDDRKGPAVELVLAGTARDLVQEIPLAQKTQGAMGDLGDGQGRRHITGLDLVVRCMNTHFAHLDD